MYLIQFGHLVMPRAPRVNRDERLRRTGYADGERKPRQARHWANR